MTSIGALGTSPTTGARRPDPMQAVTDLLGGDRKAIFSALRSGKSLDDLAKDKGVSHTDLTAAIAKGLPPGETDSAGRAEEIATTQGPPRHHGRPTGPPPAATAGGTSSASKDRLDRLSTLLGTDSATLVTTLIDGGSLSGLAAAQGVTASQVSSALQTGDLFDAYA